MSNRECPVECAGPRVGSQRALDPIEEARVQRVAVGGSPIVVHEIDRKAARVRLREFVDQSGRGILTNCGDELVALRTATVDERRVQPDEIRAAVEVAGTRIVAGLRLEHLTQEVRGLVQGVGSGLRLHVRP